MNFIAIDSTHKLLTIYILRCADCINGKHRFRTFLSFRLWCRAEDLLELNWAQCFLVIQSESIGLRCVPTMNLVDTRRTPSWNILWYWTNKTASVILRVRKYSLKNFRTQFLIHEILFIEWLIYLDLTVRKNIFALRNKFLLKKWF